MPGHEADFEFGDRVRHGTRPEWGEGTVTKVEPLPADHGGGTRVSVRFQNAGLKTLHTGQVDIFRLDDAGEKTASQGHCESPAAALLSDLDEDHWLGEVNRRKLDSAMIALPESVRDPFANPESRLTTILDLYRFDDAEHGLIEWSRAQTDLDDPMSIFSRQELEQFFERWCYERDAFLARFLEELGETSTDVDALRERIPAGVRGAIRRVGMLR